MRDKRIAKLGSVHTLAIAVEITRSYDDDNNNNNDNNNNYKTIIKPIINNNK